MSVAATGFKITSVTHGATSLGTATRARVREEYNSTPLVGGANSGPAARPVATQDVVAEISMFEPDDYVAAGTKDTLTINFRKADNAATGSIAITNMVRTGQEWTQEHNNAMEHVVEFAIEDAMASSPITIT